ncbi:hypothetical protein CPB86DRAFT_811635 [Serendipita vermifera]|nr:hypothetical protein CPB86DRAFT_811635 [Serendipita vermifera]
MQPTFFTFLFLYLVSLWAVSPVQAVFYTLTDNWVGSAFLDQFTWEAIADPTHGRVNYISQSTALSLNLTYASSTSFILKADSKNVLSSSGPGRNSNRIQSKKQFGHNTVLVADIRHMPAGCGTWPALWTTQVSNWPNNGEIDIIEGVNDVSPNTITLHTTSGLTSDCNWAVNSNSGCGVTVNKGNSYGPGFNRAGGGWYVLERTPQFIRAWFWSRSEGNIPADVTASGQTVINTDNWGTPMALFPNTQCDLSSKFGANNVIINLTFCGDWAGGVYANSGCPGSCIGT